MTELNAPLLNHDALPAVATAPLPATYEAAKRALEQCVALDECKMWANRAEAMASYARQMSDDALLKMSMRIQARATDRCGELVREIRPAKNQHDIDAGGGAPTGRFQAARRAGLSRDQTVTALRVNNVPRDEFERLVESDDPPTITKLAEIGTNHHEYLQGRAPDDFAAATPFIGLAKEFLDEARGIDLDRVSRGLTDDERDEARTNYNSVITWITRAWEVLDGI